MRMIIKLLGKGPEIDIRCHSQGCAFPAMGAEVCMFYNRLFITRKSSWKLAISGNCSHTYCLDGRNTHTNTSFIYIYHESNRELTERKRTIQVSEDTEKNNRGGELIKNKV